MSRPKGSKNKITIETKEILKSILNSNIDKIEQELSNLSGKQFIDSIFKVVEYIIPKATNEENIITEIPKLSITLKGINDK